MIVARNGGVQINWTTKRVALNRAVMRPRDYVRVSGFQTQLKNGRRTPATNSIAHRLSQHRKLDRRTNPEAKGVRNAEIP